MDKLKKYQIEIEEVLQHVFEIEAESEDEALQRAHELHDEGVWILYPDDIKDLHIRLYRDE